MTDDEKAIRAVVERWMSATKAGDLETVLDLMTDDILFLVPGRKPFGKDKFRAQSEAMRDLEIDGRSEIQEVRVLGDWAWIRNHIELTVTPSGGEPKRRSGSTLSIFQKGADGRWRLERDANLVS